MMAKNLIPRTWTAMVMKKNFFYDYSIKSKYGPMADGLWLIDLVSKNNVYCIKNIGGILVTHEDSTSKKIDIIDKAQISGFKLFKKNFDRNINFSKSEKDTILKNLEPNINYIVFKQFFSCIFKNNNEGVKKLLNFLKNNKFSKLYSKYLFLCNVLNIVPFLKILLKFINILRKLNSSIFNKYKTRKHKFLLKDIL
jgi:hypothetical protein